MNTNKPDFHQMLHIVEDWKKENHTTKDKIIFQNKDTYTNVFFDSHSLHAIQNNSRGFENLPDTIKNPKEIWSFWKDANNQTVTLRNYITFADRNCYIVQTENGKITNAFLEQASRANKYRKGVRIWQT